MSFDAFLHLILRRGTRSIREGSERLNDEEPYQPNTSKLGSRLVDVFLRTYDLGFTAFGGPPVHFQIFHRRFVDGLGKTPWIDEETVRAYGLSACLILAYSEHDLHDSIKIFLRSRKPSQAQRRLKCYSI